MAGKVAASILVRLVDQASRPASNIARALRDIGKAAKLAGGGKLEFKIGTSGARNIDAMTRSAGKLTRELRDAGKAAGAIRVPAGASPFRGMRRDVAGLLKDLERARALSRSIGVGGRGGGRYRPGAYDPPEGSGRRRHGRYDGTREGASMMGVHATYRAGQAGGRVAHLAGRVGADAMREDARDYLAGLTEGDTSKLKRRALELSVRNPSVDQNTLHEMLRDTSMSMGSPDKAIQNADNLGRMATVMQSLKGKDKAIEQVRQFYAGLDVLGKNVDPEQVARLSNAYTKATGVEGAEMNMGGVLTMAKQAKSGGAALDDKFLMSTVPALMQDLGAPQTGTALSSMVGQIIGGRGTKKSAVYQRELGMRDENNRMSERDKALITTNPFEYTIKRLIPLLEKKGISPDDDTKVVEAMSKAFSNSRVADLFTKMVSQRAQYERKAEQYDKAPGLAAADKLRSKDPYVAGSGVRAQSENVLNEAVKPYVPAVTDGLNKLTDVLGATAKSMADNPDATKVMAPVVAGIAASVGSWLAGQTLLAAAGGSTGLWAGAARLAGTGLTAAGTAAGVVAPLAGATVAGAAAQETDTKSGGMLQGLLTGGETAGQRILRLTREAQQAKAREATATELLRGGGYDFSRQNAGSLGDASGPAASAYTQSRGAFRDFLFGQERGTMNLPGFGFQGRDDEHRGPPRRPTEFGGKAPSSGPAADTVLPDGSKIAEATAALAKYQTELAGVERSLSGLKAAGEGAFSPEAFGLEARKAELEGMVTDAKAKLESLNATRVAPKGDPSGLAPLDASAEATKGKLSALDATTVSPKGDPSGLAAINAMCDQILGKMAQIGSQTGSLQGKMAGLGAAAAKAGSTLSGLERSKQTSMTSSPA